MPRRPFWKGEKIDAMPGLLGTEYAAKVAADGCQLLFTITCPDYDTSWLFIPLSFSGSSGLLAPSRTPAHIVARLTESFHLAADKPEALQRLRRIDTIPCYFHPAEFRVFLQKTWADGTAINNALDLRMDG
jgi:hypothetical protein